MAWICNCKAFNAATINRAIAECTAAPPPDVEPDQLRSIHIHAHLGATPQCGACKPEINAMLAAARPAPEAGKQAAVPAVLRR